MRDPLMGILYVSFFLIFLGLVAFTNWGADLIALISFTVSLCIFFLVVFIKRGFKILRRYLLVFSFILIPASILFFSGVYDGIPTPWNAVILVGVVAISGFLSIFVMVKLNWIGAIYEDEYIYFKSFEK